MRSRSIVPILLLGILSVSVIATLGAGFSGGAPATSAQGGCTCHGPVPLADGVTFAVAADEVEAGGTYDVTVTVSGPPALPAVAQNQGGFALQMDPVVGAFESEDGTVGSPEGTGFATHTASGTQQRSWTIQWVVPLDASGDITFHYAGNAVNGNGAADPADAWATGTAQVSVSPATQPPPGDDAEPAGTPFLSALMTAAVAVAVLLIIDVSRRRR